MALYGPDAKDGSVGVPPIEPPGPPYLEAKEESLLPVDNGEIGPPGPGLFITIQSSQPNAAHVTAREGQAGAWRESQID